MAFSTENWVFDKGVVTERDKNMLTKAKQIEENNAKKGYRWIKVNNRTKIFVECDKKGVPTKKGNKNIEILKKVLQ